MKMVMTTTTSFVCVYVSAEHDVYGWCSPCLGGAETPAIAWPILLPALPPAHRAPQHFVDGALSLPSQYRRLHPGIWCRESSSFGACPLCGLGEFGSENLLVWCPAIALAWWQLSRGQCLFLCWMPCA